MNFSGTKVVRRSDWFATKHIAQTRKVGQTKCFADRVVDPFRIGSLRNFAMARNSSLASDA